LTGSQKVGGSNPPGSTTSLTTDASDMQIGSTVKYLPFGQTLAGSVDTDKLFTGQRLDLTGLYYYGARYYDPTIGRFISPDTIVPYPINPQSLNRYSYCLNNPLKYIDPSGHRWINDGDDNIDDPETNQPHIDFILPGSQLNSQLELIFEQTVPFNSSFVITYGLVTDDSLWATIINIIIDAASLPAAAISGQTAITNAPYTVNINGNINVFHTLDGNTVVHVNMSTDSNSVRYGVNVFWQIGDKIYRTRMEQYYVEVNEPQITSYGTILNYTTQYFATIPNINNPALAAMWVSIVPLAERSTDPSGAFPFSIPPEEFIPIR
jgi:RHS repeat-associated protein